MKPPNLADLLAARLGMAAPKRPAFLPPGWRVIVGGLTAEDRDRFEERAAIREYMGNQSREEAEAGAFAEVTAPRAPRDGGDGAA